MRTARLIFAAALIAAALPAAAQAPVGAYVSDKTHTAIIWKGLHNGLAWYPARFTDFQIELDFNEADVSKSSVKATINPKSIETDFTRTRAPGNTTDFNAELATGERFFNANRFPTISFASTSIVKTGDNTGRMTGNLTFLGVTKPVTLNVAYIGNRNDPRTQKHKIGFEVTGTLKKTDFGMAPGGPIADEIRIEIHSELIQK